VRWGNTTIGPDVLSLPGDRLLLLDVGGVLDGPLVVGSLLAHLDGLGAGSGQQVLRPVVMESGRPETLAIGDEVVIDEGQAAGWVHLLFDAPPRLSAGAEPRLGLLSGSASNLARLAVDNGAPAGATVRYVSPYSAPEVGAIDADLLTLASVLAVAVEPWTPPSAITEDELADLPIDVVQATLTGGAVDVVEAAACGWHYSNESPPPPASAIVRTGGPLEQLVGQRVRLTAATPAGPAAVGVVVVDEQPFDVLDEDLSIARDAFMRLGGLWADTLTVRVEVLG